MCGFFLSSFLIKVLGDSEYGLYQMVTSFVTYLVVLEFGTGAAMTRNIAKCRSGNYTHEEIQKNISTVWTISCLLSIVILFVATVFYFQLGEIYNKLSEVQVVYAKKILLFQVTYMVVSFLSNSANGIVLGFEQYKIGPIVALVKVVSRTVLLVALVYMYKLAIIIAIVDAFLSLAIACFMFYYCLNKLKFSFSPIWFDWDIFKYTMPLCGALFLQTIVNQANSNVDLFVIGVKLSPEYVSYYSIGLFIFNTFSSLTTVPISMYGPQIIKDVTMNIDESILLSHVVSASRLITLIGSTILCGFFVCGKQFLNIFYGPQYEVSWYVALLIMIPMLVNMSNGILVSVLDALNKRASRSYILIITTILNIILTIIFVEKWGIIGASAATAISTVVGQIFIMNIYYWKVINIPVLGLYKRIYRGILIYQIIGSIIGFLIGNWINGIVFSFILSGIIYFSIFILLFYLYGAEEYEKNRIRSVLCK